MIRCVIKMIVCCGMLFLFCGFNASVRPVMVEGRRCVVLTDAARADGWQAEPAPDGRTITVSREHIAVKLVHDSAAATIVDSVRLAMLGKVLRLPNGVWVVGEEDWLKTLKPLLAIQQVPHTPVRRVVIDPGHGGHDSGAVRDGVREKDLNLRLAKQVALLLTEAGFTVILTRDGDQFVSLDARADRVRQENGDILLSLHQNASTNPAASGVEVFFASQNRYAKASMHLAHVIQLGIMVRNGGLATPMDRGIKRAGFRVLRKADCPAVLLECGFISNKQEREKLVQEEYLNALAETIAAGVAVYGKMAVPSENESAKEQIQEDEK
jgi:N-acetylmuramoyl-L-alanine amidase